jgi:hypothetical protein
MTVAVPEAPPPHYLSVRTEIVDQIGIVVIHGPKSINALNEAFILEIVEPSTASIGTQQSTA